MHRRLALAALLGGAVFPSLGQRLPNASPVDNVAVYLVPADDFSEELSAALARQLAKETRLWVKSSLRIAAPDISPLPGTNQYAAEDIFGKVLPVVKMLPDASPRTYCVILTQRDINSRNQNFRFQFSSHSPMQNASVVSLARLMNYRDGSAVLDEPAVARMYKMVKRAVGEMRLGWKRSSDPGDLMFAPIMSLEDLDRIGYTHVEQ